MGLPSATKSLFAGDLGDAFNYLFVPESEVKRSNQLDQALAAEVAADNARGLVTDEQRAVTLSRIQQNAFPLIFRQPGTNPTLGFREGLEEGIDKTRNTIGTALGIPVRLIPWQAWLLLGVAALWFTRGLWLPVLKKSLAR